MSLKILVSGAGVARATAAALLGRSGHDVCLVERDQGVRSSGAPVDVRHGAQAVIAELGLTSGLEQHATHVEIAQFVDDAGTPIAGLSTGHREPGAHEISRSALCELLVGAARQTADVRFGDAIDAITADDTGVDVTFERSRPARFDLVVAAEGIHSATRRTCFGPESSFSRPLGICVATVVTPDIDVGDHVLLHSRPGATVALHPGAGAPGAAFMFRHRAAGPVLHDRGSVDQLVRRHYQDFGWLTPALVDRYCAATDRYFDTVARLDVPRWSRGRVALLGDAAGCVSLFGEGSSSAILGADTLAESLSETGDVAAALLRYEHLHRRATASRLRGAGVASRLLIPASAFGVSARNALLRLADPTGRYRRRSPHAGTAR